MGHWSLDTTRPHWTVEKYEAKSTFSPQISPFSAVLEDAADGGVILGGNGAIIPHLLPGNEVVAPGGICDSAAGTKGQQSPMGGLTYIFGFVLNGVTASVVAALIALVSLMLPTRRTQIGDSENPPSNHKRAILVFICVWLLLMLYGCIEMFRTHHDEMDRTESARLVAGLIDREDQIIHGEHVSKGDMAQTYLMVRTTAPDVEHFVSTRHIAPFKYDAHSARDRG